MHIHIMSTQHTMHLFSDYSLIDHISEWAPVSIETTAFGVRLAEGEKVIGGEDSRRQTVVVDLTEKT